LPSLKVNVGTSPEPCLGSALGVESPSAASSDVDDSCSVICTSVVEISVADSSSFCSVALSHAGRKFLNISGNRSARNAIVAARIKMLSAPMSEVSELELFQRDSSIISRRLRLRGMLTLRYLPLIMILGFSDVRTTRHRLPGKRRVSK
jgi:hypothetical protein